MIRTSILDPDFNILFPYELFPWRLEHDNTICHFQCEEHLQKHIDRYKLKPRKYKVLNRDGKSFRSGKKYKKNVQSSTRKSNHGGTGSGKK